MEQNERTPLGNNELYLRGLRGKNVAIRQGDGGESSDYYTGKVTLVLRPGKFSPYWEIELEGHNEPIPVRNGITRVDAITAGAN